jgi:hypothetical protein
LFFFFPTGLDEITKPYEKKRRKKAAAAEIKIIITRQQHTQQE